MTLDDQFEVHDPAILANARAVLDAAGGLPGWRKRW